MLVARDGNVRGLALEMLHKGKAENRSTSATSSAFLPRSSVWAGKKKRRNRSGNIETGIPHNSEGALTSFLRKLSALCEAQKVGAWCTGAPSVFGKAKTIAHYVSLA